jgi:predicted phage-related endonuclease
VIVGEKRILECKNVDHWYAQSDAWGEAGSDKVPMPYLLQCHHYMIVMGYPVCDLAAVMGGNRMRIYTIEHDPEMAEALIDNEAEFWDRVENKQPPDPITHDDVEMLYPVDDGRDLIVAPHDRLVTAVGELRQLKALAKETDADINELIKEIKIFLAGHSRLCGDATTKDVLCTWKKSKDGKHFNEAKFAREFPELYSMYQETKPGTRRFVVNMPKETKADFTETLSKTIGDKQR